MWRDLLTLPHNWKLIPTCKTHTEIHHFYVKDYACLCTKDLLIVPYIRTKVQFFILQN